MKSRLLPIIPCVMLRPADIRWWRGMHRVVIQLDRAWIPAEVIPGSQDTRTLGLQVGEVSLK